MTPNEQRLDVANRTKWLIALAIDPVGRRESPRRAPLHVVSCETSPGPGTIVPIPVRPAVAHPLEDLVA